MICRKVGGGPPYKTLLWKCQIQIMTAQICIQNASTYLRRDFTVTYTFWVIAIKNTATYYLIRVEGGGGERSHPFAPSENVKLTGCRKVWMRKTNLIKNLIKTIVKKIFFWSFRIEVQINARSLVRRQKIKKGNWKRGNWTKTNICMNCFKNGLNKLNFNTNYINFDDIHVTSFFSTTYCVTWDWHQREIGRTFPVYIIRDPCFTSF